MAIQEGNSLPEAAPRGFCPAAAAVVLTCMAAGVTAAETSHGVHEHGAAEIELVVEGSDVLVHFASPLYNLVGFEHAPRDEHDREAVAAARVLLDGPENLVLLQADAACAVVEVDVDWDLPSAEEKEHDHDGAEAHDAHGDHHADEHDAHEADEHDAHESDEHDAHESDEHDAHEHDAHDAGEQHADATVEIRYRCEHPDRLNALDITAFETFERLSEVELRGVGPGGAVAESLERGSPRVDLRGLFGR